MANKQEFAHILRGVAAVSVMLAHYCGIFFLMNEWIAKLLLVPPLPALPAPTGPAQFVGYWAIQLSEFGVGIFFIISGFVVPFSLTSTTTAGFLTRRVARIFPVYIIGFSLVMFSIWLLTRYAGTPFEYSAAHIASHYGIISRGFTDYARLDGISWTLEIELWFYLALALIGSRWILRSALSLVISAFAVAGLSLLCTKLRLGGYIGIVGNADHQIWVSLLLISGLSYHSLFCRKIEVAAFFAIQGVVAGLLTLIWYWSFNTEFYQKWLEGYLAAMVIFACAYALRDRIKSNRLFDHFADISYPLYVVHALTGYVVMYWVISNGGGAGVAIFSAAAVSYALAVGLHYLVEKPFIQLSKSPQRRNRAQLQSSA